VDSAFQWVNQLFSWFGKFIPKWIVVEDTRSGVAWVRGKSRLIPSGCVYWYWPAWTEISLINIVRQTINLPSQVLMVPPGDRTIIIGGIVVYSIKDTLKVITKLYDQDDTIRDIALSAIKQALWGKSIQNLLGTDQSELDSDLTKALKRELYGFGIDVIKVNLSDIATCRVIRNVNDVAGGFVPLQEEDDIE